MAAILGRRIVDCQRFTILRALDATIDTNQRAASRCV